MIELKLNDGSYILHPTKIICLLRSYAAHAREMNNKVPEKPRFFLKPPSSLLESGGMVIIPTGSTTVHHEVELVVVIGKKGKEIRYEDAKDHILGFMVGLDITARDIQLEAKKEGLPWTEAKGYDTFAPVGNEIMDAHYHDWRSRSIWLDVNGKRRQESNTDLLLWPVERIISDLSHIMTLEEGDMIMTGTPSGVGPLVPGDIVKAGIEGIGTLEIKVATRKVEGTGMEG